MESFLSLGAPLKHFTTCMSTNKAPNKRGAKKSPSARRSSFTRRRSVSRRRSLPCSSQKVPDSWLRVYQEELKRERKRQQALVAKKNSEKSVRRLNFRSHHCLPRSLHHQSSTTRKAAPQTKDDSFFRNFQGLSLHELIGGTNAPPAAAPAAGGDQCKVM